MFPGKRKVGYYHGCYVLELRIIGMTEATIESNKLVINKTCTKDIPYVVLTDLHQGVGYSGTFSLANTHEIRLMYHLYN